MTETRWRQTSRLTLNGLKWYRCGAVLLGTPINLTWLILDKVIFEGELNENSTDFAHLGYPLYPNAAGMAWIEMIKNKWSSNEVIELSSSTDDDIFQRNLFNGKFSIDLISPSGVVKSSLTTSISNKDCFYYQNNMIPDG